MATPKFIPITLQVLLGDSKAKINEVRTGLNDVDKQAANLKSSLSSSVGSAFSGLKDSLGKAVGGGDFLKNLLPSAGALQGQLGGVSSGLAGLVGIAGLAGSAFIGLTVAVGTATLQLAKQADELKLTAAVTGLNIQQLQTYQNAAKITGNSVNVLTDGVLQYRQRAKEALDGNLQLARSFTSLGVDLKTAVSNPSASFESLLDQLQALPNDVQRVNAIQSIFGETNRELTGIIISLTENQGELRKELQATGTAMNDQAVKDLAQLNREYELLTLKVENLGKKGLVGLYNSLRLSVQGTNDGTSATNFLVGAVGQLIGKFVDAPPTINATTSALQEQVGVVDSLNSSLAATSFAGLQTRVKEQAAQISESLASAKRVLTEKEASDVIKFKFQTDPQFKQDVEIERARRINDQRVNDALFPSLKPKKTGSGKAKELTELQQLQKQVREINKDLSGFQNLTSQEFKLRLELEDKRNLKNELEGIIKLRRTSGEPVAVALPANLAGVDKEKSRLNELKQLKELTAKNDLFGPIRESFNATSQATAAQFQALDKIINDALPKAEAATTAQAVAQNELFLSLQKTNPALAEYYLKQAQAADATNANTQAAQAFSSLRDQLNGQLSQFNNLTTAQTTALTLQGDAYKNLTDVQRQELISLGQQIDGQNLYKQQLDESQQRVEAFANQLRGVFDRLLDGPKAFFDGIKQTLKRTLSQMLSDLLTSQALKILGIVPGAQAAPAFAGIGGGGQSAGGSGGGGVGGFISQFLKPSGGNSSGGGGNLLTGGFSGGNPAQQILNSGGGNGGGSGLPGLLGKLPGIGKFFNPAQSAGGVGNLPIFTQGGNGGALSQAGGALSKGGAVGSVAALGATGLLSGGFLGGSLLGGNSQIGKLIGGGGGLLAAGALGATGIFGGGVAAALPALFSNPITAIVAGGLIGGALLFRFFADRTFNKFRKEVKSAYQIEVDKKQAGRGLFKQTEEIGKQRFGKDFKNKIPEVIQLKSVKEFIANYGLATGQDRSSLVRQVAEKQKVSDPDNVRNQIVRREFGGPVRGGSPVLVGERRAEILVPGSDGFVFPSIAAYERQLIAALQKRAAGGFFGGAFGKLASQIEASAFSRSAGGGASTGNGIGSSDLMLGVLAELTEAVASLRGIPPSHVVSQGLRENPNLASRALVSDLRSASPEAKQIIKSAKGYK